MPIESVEDMKAAARQLHRLGPRCVLIKGGHLVAQQAAAAAAGANAAVNGTVNGAADAQQQLQAVDVLYDGEELLELRAPYVSTPNTHGTGCTLASAIAAHLARGLPMREAVAAAKRYLTTVLAGSRGMRLGEGPQHPFHHGYGLTGGPGLEAATPAPGAAGLPSSGVSSSGGRRSSSASGSAAAIEVMRTPGTGTAAAGGPCCRSAGAEFNSADLRVYAVTDADCNARSGRSLVDAVRGAVAGGATLVQVR